MIALVFRIKVKVVVRNNRSQIFFQNRCSEKFRNIHLKTPVMESPFIKVARDFNAGFVM